MDRLSERLEQIFVDIAFAEEAGLTVQGSSLGLTETIDTIFTAITFAEAGEPAIALEVMGSNSGDSHHPTSQNHNDLGCFCMGKA